MNDDADRKAIRALIETQFDTLCWQPGETPDFRPLLDGFLADAPLFASARPVQAQTAGVFCARLDGLRRDGPLAGFHERMLGLSVEVFGNVAVAMAGCAMTENGERVTRDVSGFLLVRDGGAWKIAAQAWDLETPETAASPFLQERDPETGSV